MKTEIILKYPNLCNGCPHLSPGSVFTCRCQLLDIHPNKGGKGHRDEYTRPQICIDKHGL